MSADLDRLDNGDAAVLSIGETPWHREGTIKLDRTDPETILLATDLDAAMQVAGLDFGVVKLPVMTTVPGATWERLADGRVAIDPEKLKKVDGGFAVFRTDRWTTVGNVGTDYTPLQNRDAFEPARALLDAGMATTETAGSLSGGSDVWWLLRLDVEAIVRHAEAKIAAKYPGAAVARRMDALEAYLTEILPFLHLSNHHGGRRSATVQETGVRVVCANTQSAALDGDAAGIRIAVRHSGDVSERYAEAVDDLMGQLALRYLSLSDARVVLRQVELDREAYERLVLERAVPVAHLRRKIQQREGNARTEAALRRSEAKRDEIHRLWTAGKGHVGDHSAWEAYQGLVEWLDHGDGETGPRFRDSRLQSLNEGTLGQVKSTVYRDLAFHSLKRLDAPEFADAVIGG